MKSMLLFDLIDLLAECRLGDVQRVGGASEIQLLGQDKDCLQVTYFDPGEHGSNPPFAKRRRFVTALHLVKEREGKKKYQKELLDSGGGAQSRDGECLTDARFGWHAFWPSNYQLG